MTEEIPEEYQARLKRWARFLQVPHDELKVEFLRLVNARRKAKRGDPWGVAFTRLVVRRRKK